MTEPLSLLNIFHNALYLAVNVKDDVITIEILNWEIYDATIQNIGWGEAVESLAIPTDNVATKGLTQNYFAHWNEETNVVTIITITERNKANNITFTVYFFIFCPF